MSLKESAAAAWMFVINTMERWRALVSMFNISPRAIFTKQRPPNCKSSLNPLKKKQNQKLCKCYKAIQNYFPSTVLGAECQCIFCSQLIQPFLSRMIALSNPTERLFVLEQKAVCIVYVNANPQVANGCSLEWRQTATWRLLRRDRALDARRRKLLQEIHWSPLVPLWTLGSQAKPPLQPSAHPAILLSAVILELINSTGKEDPFNWCQTTPSPKTVHKSFSTGILHSRKWTSWSSALILYYC